MSSSTGRSDRDEDAAAESWDNATPDEIRDARIQSLEEGLEQLFHVVWEALTYGRTTKDAADIMRDEWGK